MSDLIERQAAIDALNECRERTERSEEFAGLKIAVGVMRALPSAQPEYEPVKADDFAKTMSENTLYSFMAWHGEALELMERQGFVICKKTM